MECRRRGGCPPGEARLTRGYRLRASHVIHAVGPIWQGGSAAEQRILEACYRSSLAIAQRPEISRDRISGDCNRDYRYPRDAAARVAVATVCSYLTQQQWPELVAFVCFDATTFEAYLEALG